MELGEKINNGDNRYATIEKGLKRRKTCKYLGIFDGLVSLLNGISTFVGYLMSNPSV